MKNLKSVSNQSLLENTKALAAEERRVTTEVLWHLFEIQRRRLFAERGYESLFAYAVKELGYSEASAGRRIAAMRLLSDVPELEPSLQAGELNLSTLSQLQHFFRRQEEPATPQEKKELALALCGKSRRECEKKLAEIDPQAMPKEKERVITPEFTEIRFVADEALMGKLKRIRELDAHANPDSSYLALFHRLADLALKKLDPEKKTQRSASPPAESKSENPRYIPAALKRAIYARDQGRCAYHSKDGRRCGSRYALEIDHIQPLAQGGQTGIENLRLLCRSHHQQQSLLKLGTEVMRPYMRT